MSKLIMISGPTSAETEEAKAENVARLNRAAAEVLRRGHVPVVGVNAAAPVVEQAAVGDRYEAIMRICLALAESGRSELSRRSSFAAAFVIK